MRTELIKQAEADAAKAREQTLAASRRQAEQAPSPGATLFPPNVGAPSADNVAPLPPVVTPPPPPPGGSSDEVRVPYVPEIVRRQIADEVRAEVMQQARAENWASPRTLPGWILRLTPFADFRLRYEGDFYPDGNDNTGGVSKLSTPSTRERRLTPRARPSLRN